MPLVREAARTALNIDPSLPEAHALLGAVAAIYDYDWVEAERLFRLATRGDPVPPIVRFTSMSSCCRLAGHRRPSRSTSRGLQRRPTGSLGRFQLAFCLQVAGCRRRPRRNFAGFWTSTELLARRSRPSMTFALEGKLPEAIDFAERAFALAPWSSNTARSLAAC